MGKPVADTSKGEVLIHNKVYLTVARRIDDFRKQHPDYGIETTILEATHEYVRARTVITNEEGRVIATGLSEEVRAASKINKTSALENAETSAVGRALAFFGMGGTEIASADEVSNAISSQNAAEAMQPLLDHNKMMQSPVMLRTVADLKEALIKEDFGLATQLEDELTPAEREMLWMAPTKGGLFTTDERALIRSDAMNAARKANVQGGQ